MVLFNPNFGVLFDRTGVCTSTEVSYLSRYQFLGVFIGIVPVKFVMVVDKDEGAALEVDPVVCEVQERCEVETAVGLLVDVHVPVLAKK